MQSRIADQYCLKLLDRKRHNVQTTFMVEVDWDLTILDKWTLFRNNIEYLYMCKNPHSMLDLYPWKIQGLSIMSALAYLFVELVFNP